MSPQSASKPPKPVLISKNVPKANLRSAVPAQDLDKRTTATRPIRSGRSLRGGKR